MIPAPDIKTPGCSGVQPRPHSSFLNVDFHPNSDLLSSPSPCPLSQGTILD